MAHNIDQSNARSNIAFLGSRNDVWHRLGQEMQPGMTIEQWASAAGLDWQATLVPAIADKSAIGMGQEIVPDRFFNVRSDTGHVLGIFSDRYQNVQPRDVLAWFYRYISVDDRFQLDVAGSLRSGEIIWATARFNGPMSVAGDTHTARLLMSTTFDGSGATINQATMTRAVCQNTLNAALLDKRACVRTRHNTKFNAASVAKELANIAQGFEVYKLMGDALTMAEMSREQVADFFRDCLDIPKDAKRDDISTRKSNQYLEIAAAYRTSVSEGATGAWAALNAITRYADHDRSTRGGNGGEMEARFTSSQFGSGAALKAKAVGLLMPMIRDKVPALAA